MAFLFSSGKTNLRDKSMRLYGHILYVESDTNNIINITKQNPLKYVTSIELMFMAYT